MWPAVQITHFNYDTISLHTNREVFMKNTCDVNGYNINERVSMGSKLTYDYALHHGHHDVREKLV